MSSAGEAIFQVVSFVANCRKLPGVSGCFDRSYRFQVDAQADVQNAGSVHAGKREESRPRQHGQENRLEHKQVLHYSGGVARIARFSSAARNAIEDSPGEMEERVFISVWKRNG